MDNKNDEIKIYKESHGTGTISSIVFLIVIAVIMYFVAKAIGM